MSEKEKEDFYKKVENVKKIEERQRYCESCNKKKMTQYKINGIAICDGCLDFIAGLDNFAKMGRNIPPS